MLNLKDVFILGREAEITSLSVVSALLSRPRQGVRSGLLKAVPGTSTRAERVAKEIAKAFSWRRLWGCSLEPGGWRVGGAEDAQPPPTKGNVGGAGAPGRSGAQGLSPHSLRSKSAPDSPRPRGGASQA